MVRIRINLGRRQSMLPPQIIGLINQATHTRNIRLGRIDINTDWSDVQVEASMADRVEQSLRGFDFRGIKIRVERGADGREGNAYKGRRGPGRNDKNKKYGKPGQTRHGQTRPGKKRKG